MTVIACKVNYLAGSYGPFLLGSTAGVRVLLGNQIYIVMRLFSLLSTAFVLLLFLLTPVPAQQSSALDYTHITITLKAEGGPCGCVYANDEDFSCCPAYSVAVDENGTVVYNGIGGVKARGERVHSIPVGAVRELVAGFFRINFFSLQDRYTSKKLPNGKSQTVDHANATTISIDINGKKKSVYIFYGAPDDLMDLQRKLYDVTQIAQYVGSALTLERTRHERASC